MTYSDTADYLIKPYKYKTGRIRKPSNKGNFIESKKQILDNNIFEIKFYIPRLDRKKIKHFLIIVNGFNEMSPGPYHREEKGICCQLASKGIASVLIPIPFHMNRMPKNLYPKNHQPKHLIIDDKDRFYEGYRQLVADVEKLGKIIKDKARKDEIIFSDKTKLLDLLSEDINVHLLGYSIGGLGVLSAFLKAYYQNNFELFDSCSLLSSGANLETLHPEELIEIEEDAWKQVKHHYLGKAYKKEEISKSLMNKIFEMVLLGEKEDSFKNTLRDLSNRILLVVGAMDDVSNPSSVDRFEPEETGLAIIKVPGLEHKFASKGWQAWQTWIIDCVISFIKEHPAKVVKSKLFKRTMTQKALTKIIMSTKSERVLKFSEKLIKLSKRGSI